MGFTSKKIVDEKELGFRKILGAFIKSQREEDLISLNFVADGTKINKGYLSEMESGFRNISRENCDFIFDFLEIKYNFDESIYYEIQKKLYNYYELYIALQENREKLVANDILSEEEKYTYSYGHFIYKLFKLIYLIRYECDNKTEIFEISKLIDKYLYLYTDNEKTIYYDALVQYHIINGNVRKALLYLKQAKNFCPDKPKIIGLKAILLYHDILVLQFTNKSALAYKTCQEAKYEFVKNKLYNRSFYVDMYEGNCLSRLNLSKEAEKVYYSILEQIEIAEDPYFTCAIYDNLSWNYLKNGEYNNCIEFVQKSVSLGYNIKDVFTYIPYCLYKLDRKIECQDYISHLQINKLNRESIYFINMIKFRITKEDDNFLQNTIKYIEHCTDLKKYESKLIALEMLSDFFMEKRDYKSLVEAQNEIIRVIKKK